MVKSQSDTRTILKYVAITEINSKFYRKVMSRWSLQKRYFFFLLQNETLLETTSQGPCIRVEEMRRERCIKGMPGLLLASPIDVTSASLGSKETRKRD